MADEKKIVIKINYPNRSGELPESEIKATEFLTEWNINRILGAVGFICLALLGVYFWVKSETVVDENESAAVPALPVKTIIESTQLAKSSDKSSATEERPVSADNKSGMQLPPASIDNTPEITIPDVAAERRIAVQKTASVTSSAAAAATGQVIRGGLANAIENKEPKGNVALPLLLNNNDEKTLYYFTELKGMSGKVVYHEWLYKGKSVFKRPIKITEPHWRTATHKIIRSTAPGDWSVRVVDENGAVMHQIDFKVVVAN